MNMNLLLAAVLAAALPAAARADAFVYEQEIGGLVKDIRAARPAAVLAQAAPSNAPGAGDYSEGYRMGLMSKFSVKGLINKSGEGELLLGQDSSIAYRGSGDSRTQINPWKFSADPAKAGAAEAHAGEYVVIKYHQSTFRNPLTRSTSYELMELARVDTSSKPKTVCEADGRGSRSEGFRVARIVKASSKGVATKSYEVTLQVGGTGNEFLDMGAPTEAMYECVVRWLKSGGKAKVWYSQSFFHNPLTRSTSYDIVKIEPLPSLD